MKIAKPKDKTKEIFITLFLCASVIFLIIDLIFKTSRLRILSSE